ncbi:hypothetical protein EVAR_78680_1 [Eumeta japonica]|uniref:Craniofacial development protein 2 n=1 Tax=Eumeta variegata TaxID=151549 RepID=A0A4C1U7X9_EUMVA|nr:hypothetical protein EVAR_78680_1 [Eumeta japonica]
MLAAKLIQHRHQEACQPDHAAALFRLVGMTEEERERAVNTDAEKEVAMLPPDTPSSPEGRKGEMRTREVRFGTLNVCGGMDDKIDDICELMKDRRLDILCVNETKRKGSGGVIKRGSFVTYWSGVDQSQRGCRGVGFILPERLS